MTWSAIRAAIVSWVRAATGLGAEHVFWTQAGRPRPSGRYVELRARRVGVIGRDWVDASATVTPDPGEEVTHTARGAREITVEMQCFEGIGTSTADSPSDYLERTLLAARLPARAAAFAAAGIGLGRVGPVLAMDGDIGFSVFEPRAIAEVRFHATSEATELGGSIDTVEVTNEIHDPDSTFTIEA